MASHEFGIRSPSWSGESTKLLYLIITISLSRFEYRPVPSLIVTDGFPWTAPNGDSIRFHPAALPIAWWPRHSPSRGIVIEPSVNLPDIPLRAISIVMGEASGLAGPGPRMILDGFS